MRITFEMVAAYLSKTYNVHVISRYEHDTVTPPLFYRKGMDTEWNQLYIVSEDLPSVTAKGIFIFCQPTELGHISYSYVMCNEPNSVLDILNSLQQLYQHCEKWEDMLIQALNERVSLQELLDIGAEFMQCQLSVVDENLQQLALSTNSGNVNELSFIELYGEHLLDLMERINVQVEGDFYVLQLSKLPDTKMNHDIYSIQIKEGESVFGSFSMYSTNRVLLKHDFQLFKIMYEYIRKYLFSPVRNEKYMYTQLIERLLRQEEVTQSELLNLKSYAKGVLECLVINVPPKILSQYGGLIKSRIEFAFPNSIPFMTEKLLVCITYNAKPIFQNIEMQTLLMNTIGTPHITMGISKPFQVWDELSLYYEQAITALRYTTQHNQIQLFSHIWLSIILDKLIEQWPNEALYLESFQRLLQYNEGTAVDYIESLQIWLEEGLNDSRTAARLYISRNSFLSRRERLVKILDEDINDPEVRFQLYMNIRLYRQQEKNIT